MSGVSENMKVNRFLIASLTISLMINFCCLWSFQNVRTLGICSSYVGKKNGKPISILQCSSMENSGYIVTSDRIFPYAYAQGDPRGVTVYLGIKRDPSSAFQIFGNRLYHLTNRKADTYSDSGKYGDWNPKEKLIDVYGSFEFTDIDGDRYHYNLLSKSP
jgi:hypothetical protein